MPMTPKSCSRCDSCVAKENHEAQPLMFQFVGRLRSLRTTEPSLSAILHLLLWMRHLLVWLLRIHVFASLPHPPLRSNISVLAAHQSPFRGSSGKICSHCKKSGHTVDNCFALHPELLAEYQRKSLFSSRVTLLLGSLLLLWLANHSHSRHNSQQWVHLCPLLICISSPNSLAWRKLPHVTSVHYSEC